MLAVLSGKMSVYYLPFRHGEADYKAYTKKKGFGNHEHRKKIVI